MFVNQGKVNSHQPPIAIGRTAEVFAWGSGQVLKLYLPEMPREWRDYEAKVGRIVVEAGLAQRQQLLANLERLPDGRAVCRGDFHPGNVLITSRGPLVIDWITASHGHPLVDVTRTMMILQGTGPLPEPLPVGLRILLAMQRMLQSVYLREYFHLRPGSKKEMERWIPLQAAARLNEDIPGEKPDLLARIEKGLSKQPFSEE